MTKRVSKNTKTVSQIKDEIKKLKEELKSKTELKPFVLNLEVHITPVFSPYGSEEYEAEIEKVVCKVDQKLGDMAYQHIDTSLCRDFLTQFYGHETVLAAEDALNGVEDE